MSKALVPSLRTMFATPEEAMKQQLIYPRIPKGEAIVLAPLASGKFDPDVVLIYGTPAQLMMILCGLQKLEFERFQFSFIGKEAGADSLAQCYVSEKPSLAMRVRVGVTHFHASRRPLGHEGLLRIEFTAYEEL